MPVDSETCEDFGDYGGDMLYEDEGPPIYDPMEQVIPSCRYRNRTFVHKSIPVLGISTNYDTGNWCCGSASKLDLYSLTS